MRIENQFLLSLLNELDNIDFRINNGYMAHHFHGKVEAWMQDQRSRCEFLTRLIERRNFVPSSGISLGSPLDKSCLDFVQTNSFGLSSGA